VSRDFLLLVFFKNQFPSSPRVSHQDRFEFFAKIHGDICNPRCTTGINDTSGKFSTTPAANFATSFASVFDTRGKFSTGVNDTGGK
jgi:hypothetical protein